MTDYLKLALETEKDWRSLFDRMDDDRYLEQLSPYTLTDRDGNPVTGVLNTTLNDPAMFSAWVKAALLNMKWSYTITGDKLSDQDTFRLERWHNARFKDADLRLQRQGKPPLRSVNFEQACMRGRMATRCLTYSDGVIDLTPCDTRYFTYDSTPDDGPIWVAPYYTRTKAMIESEYHEDYHLARIDSYNWSGRQDGKTVVHDIWFKEKIGNDWSVWNQVYIGGNLDNGGGTQIEERSARDLLGYDIDYVPFSIQTVPLGNFYADDDNLKREGESIFWLGRPIIPLLNEVITILRAQLFKSHKAAWMWKASSEMPEDNPEAGDAVKVNPDEKGWEQIPVNPQGAADLAVRLLAEFDKRMQAATVSRIEENALQYMSVAGIQEIQATRDKLYVPRLKANRDMELEIGEMFTKQAQALGRPIMTSMGEFNPSKFPENYKVELDFDTDEASTNVANWTMYAAVGPNYPEKRKLQEFIGVQDIGTVMAELNIERARLKDPATDFLMTAREYAYMLNTDTDEDNEIHWWSCMMFARRAVAMFTQMLMTGQLPPENQNTSDNVMMNVGPRLLAQGAGGGKT